MTIITNAALTAQKSGLLISFEKQAGKISRTRGKDYISAHEHEVRTRGKFNRAAFARPHIVGFLRQLEDGPDIVSNGIILKPRDGFLAGVPECFDFTLPMARIVGSDVLKNYGAEKFEASEIILIVQRTDVRTAKSHRPAFESWHNHLSGGANRMDLIYSFCTVLPTEFMVGGRAVATEENSLTRFGAEQKHRSVKNADAGTLRRTWGAFIISYEPTPVGRSFTVHADNVAFSGHHAERKLISAGNKYLREKNNFISFEPAPLL
jgi:hypothetical protein